jgi:hypothetical protein
MLGSILLALSFQVGPFYEQRPDDGYYALRPLYAQEGDVTDIVWPLFTKHETWWRALWFIHYQDTGEDSQFDLMPLWFNGETREGETYWGLFPLYGHHPHFLLVYDLDFALWPFWMRYKMPRPSEDRWMTSNVVLFPFFHWRDDGSWGVWPLYGVGHQRESDHRYTLWPIVTWANYRSDRDTSGAGYSWWVWPLYGSVERERESQTMFIPPFFGYAETPHVKRWRLPWPIVEWERGTKRDRTSIFPLWESVADKRYSDGQVESRTTRFGYKLVELYDTETRVFPFWASRKDGSYLRVWPFYEHEETDDGMTHGSVLSLMPIRWVPQIDRNWAKFWTFYEFESCPMHTDHSLLWGIIRWRTHEN